MGPEGGVGGGGEGGRPPVHPSTGSAWATNRLHQFPPGGPHPCSHPTRPHPVWCWPQQPCPPQDPYTHSTVRARSSSLGERGVPSSFRLCGFPGSTMPGLPGSTTLAPAHTSSSQPSLLGRWAAGMGGARGEKPAGSLVSSGWIGATAAVPEAAGVASCLWPGPGVACGRSVPDRQTWSPPFVLGFGARRLPRRWRMAHRPRVHAGRPARAEPHGAAKLRDPRVLRFAT